MRKLEFNAWIPELGYMLEDVALGHGSIGFPSDDEDFANALKAKGFDPEELNLPTWLYDTGEDWYRITDPKAFEIVQFIGLKDINDKRIFESDIVEVTHEEGLSFSKVYRDIGLVKYSEASFSVKCKSEQNKLAKDLSKRYFYLHFNKKRHYKVLGNIYQNPELIKL